MSEGSWNTAFALEQIRQSGHMRGRFLTVYTGPSTDVLYDPAVAGSAWASTPPSNGGITAPLNEVGPHFTLSPQTPDGRPTLGFEWVLMEFLVPSPVAVADTGGFTVTVWKLLENLQVANTPGPWAKFTPVTGVAYTELYRTFDANACTIRFQIDNVATDGNLVIYVTEL